MLRSKPSHPTRHVGILAFLFPALLLLPTLHLHPAYEHTHERHGAHQHAPVVHADFLPVSVHAHGEHHRGHDVPGDASPAPLSQISFRALLSRSFEPPALTLERVPSALPVQAPISPVAVSSYTWVLPRDHSPPASNLFFPSTSPRSPPLFA
jgi:hypothetical protein